MGNFSNGQKGAFGAKKFKPYGVVIERGDDIHTVRGLMGIERPNCGRRQRARMKNFVKRMVMRKQHEIVSIKTKTKVNFMDKMKGLFRRSSRRGA